VLILPNATESVKKPFLDGLTLFEQALDTWLPCFGKVSINSSPNSGGTPGGFLVDFSAFRIKEVMLMFRAVHPMAIACCVTSMLYVSLVQLYSSLVAFCRRKCVVWSRFISSYCLQEDPLNVVLIMFMFLELMTGVFARLHCSSVKSAYSTRATRYNPFYSLKTDYTARVNADIQWPTAHRVLATGLPTLNPETALVLRQLTIARVQGYVQRR
jgi:hypothetical protein